MRTSNVVRSIAWLTLVVTLMFLFVQSLGDISINGVPDASEYQDQPNIVLGLILLGTGLMILIETVFTRNFPEISNPRSINFVLGLPSGIVAIGLGISWIFGFATIINIFGVFLDGVYLSGLIILLYEGTMTQLGTEL